MYLPQDVYDEIMALPPGSDITRYFEFEPGWDLRVTAAPVGAQPDTGEEGNDNDCG